MAGRSVTWIYYGCGHSAPLDRQDGTRESILTRFRCDKCGQKPDDLRHGVRVVRRAVGQKPGAASGGRNQSRAALSVHIGY